MSSIYFGPSVCAISLVVSALGQTQSRQTQFDGTSERSFNLAAGISEESFAEMATTLRAVAGVIPQLPIDPASESILLKGKADQLAMAGWLVEKLSAANPQNSIGNRFESPDGSIAAIFILPAATMPRTIEEVVTTLREIAEVRNISGFGCTAIALAGTQNQVELAEWLLPRLTEPGSETAPDIRRSPLP